MDDLRPRAERALENVFSRLGAAAGPPRLAEALRYSVFPGGARLRPRLALAVANTLSDPTPTLTDAVASSIELLHCASLVHDDLPCFDAAALRRGRPSVHAAFGEATAVLAGDGLIVMAFEALATAEVEDRAKLPELIAMLARAAGHPRGLVAGQGWEGERKVSLATYHGAKTAGLFGAAAAMGALAAGGDPASFRVVGELVGQAYQVADDVVDAIGTRQASGKDVGVDAARDRPSAVAERGVDRCLVDVQTLLEDAVDAAPTEARRGALRDWLRAATADVLAAARGEPRVQPGEQATPGS